MPVLFNALAPSVPSPKNRAIAICGASQDAMAIARELISHGEEVIIMNEDTQMLEKARKAGMKTLQISKDSPFGSMQPDSLKGFAAICSDDDLNLGLSKSAVAAGIQPVVVQVTDPARLSEFRMQGVQPFVPGMAHTVLLALLVRNPDVYTLLTSKTDERDIREVTVNNTSVSGKRLRDMGLPGDLLVLTIRRGEDFIIPHGNVEIELFDRLTLLGCLPDLEEVEQMIS
jgi:Trk K+ transport system NAD-binding subunit